MQQNDFEKNRLLATELAKWDTHIVEIISITDSGEESEKKVNLVCRFDPEPISDTTGFFWIASLITRMEFEALDERLGITQPFDIGFKLGKQVFLPNGKILNTIKDEVVLWPVKKE